MTTDMGPLDLASVASHVAVALDRAVPAALPVDELAAGYRHPISADLVRVKNHEGYSRDADAVDWMVRQVVADFARRGKVVDDDGKIRLADGVTLDGLRWNRRKIYEIRDAHERLKDPFNPMSGRFSDNVRRPGKDTADELRESMREFGWIEQLPAIRDERGVVLVGHRRLKVAAELGIDPVLVTVVCGDGDEADAKRFRMAIASNIGAKPFTMEERKDIAEHLYGERGWRMAEIGKALGVSAQTISKDLGGFKPGLKPPRPQGGRPRKSEAPPNERSKLFTKEVLDRIALEVVDGGKSAEHAARNAGWTGRNTSGPVIVKQAVERLRGQREGVAATAAAPPVRQPEPVEPTAVVTGRPHCPTCRCDTAEES